MQPRLEQQTARLICTNYVQQELYTIPENSITDLFLLYNLRISIISMFVVFNTQEATGCTFKNNSFGHIQSDTIYRFIHKSLTHFIK